MRRCMRNLPLHGCWDVPYVEHTHLTIARNCCAALGTKLPVLAPRESNVHAIGIREHLDIEDVGSVPSVNDC